MTDIATKLKNFDGERVKIFFAGDVVLNDDLYKGKSLVSSELHSLIEQQDIACCNLEGPVEKEGLTPQLKRGPSVRNGTLTPKRLKESGFNMCILANNHIMDYGIDGLRHSLDVLKKDFYCIGAEIDIDAIYRLQKIQKGNLTIGFIAVGESQFGVCKENSGGFAWMLSARLLQLFAQAKEECDYYFIICHCGAEELMVPLPEVRELYRAYIDLGADAVIGHHPHVVQGCEEYRGKKIFYSLGNFTFDLEGKDEPYNPIGLCVLIEIHKGGIEFRTIVTEYKDGQVGIKRGANEFEEADRLLKSGEVYQKEVNQYCINAYETCFRQYYALILGMDIESKENLAKFAQHRLNGDKILWDDLFVYHNIAIETNRWICERAIKLIHSNDRKK